MQEEFNMKTTNRQVENTIKLHAAKEPSCGKRSDSDNEFVVQRFVGNGNVVTRIGSRKAMSAIPENRENGNEQMYIIHKCPGKEILYNQSAI